MKKIIIISIFVLSSITLFSQCKCKNVSIDSIVHYGEFVTSIDKFTYSDSLNQNVYYQIFFYKGIIFEIQAYWGWEYVNANLYLEVIKPYGTKCRTHSKRWAKKHHMSYLYDNGSEEWYILR